MVEGSELDVMPLLLSDASSCCNDLGRILYANPNEWNVYMNIVDTNTLSSFLSSHVEYQMSLCVSFFFVPLLNKALI